MINYSVIIPHKDIPHLLQRCLDSIPRREDVQIIVVDDNSDPAVVDFAHFPGLNDPHIEIIFGKNENGRKGAGYARNLGMERAAGKWLVFADADDFFLPCISEAFDKYKDDENDIIYFYPTSADGETLIPGTGSRHLYITKYLDKIQRTGCYDELYAVSSVVFGTFFKRKNLSESVRFPEWTTQGEDTLFAVQIQSLSTAVCICTYIVYCATERKGSLSTLRTTEMMLDRFNAELAVIFLYLRAGGKDRYRKLELYGCWSELFDMDRKAALQMLPYMVERYGGYSFIIWRFLLNQVVKKLLVDKNIVGFGKLLYRWYKKKQK